MQKFDDDAFEALHKIVSAGQPASWQESVVEWHDSFDQVPIFVLLSKNYDLEKSGAAMRDVFRWYYSRYERPELTCSFHVINENNFVTLAYLEGKGALKQLKSLKPMEPISIRPMTQHEVFQSEQSL